MTDSIDLNLAYAQDARMSIFLDQESVRFLEEHTPRMFKVLTQMREHFNCQ